jgi:probable HAF family extracellular repeat protein
MRHRPTSFARALRARCPGAAAARRVLPGLGLGALVLGASATAHAQAHFEGLGFLSAPSPGSAAWGMSADGGVVVGLAQAGAGQQAFRWMRTTGMVALGDLPGGAIASWAYGCSPDGRTVVGLGQSTASAPNSEAFRWVAGAGMTGLGSIPGGAAFLSEAYSCSTDGAVVVGLSTGPNGFEAFRWTSPGGMTGLGFLPGGTFSSAQGVTPDGLTIVGYSWTTDHGGGNEACMWTAAREIRPLGDLPGGTFFSVANAVSADGTTAVGQSSSANSGFFGEAFRWTQASGMVGLGDLPGGDFKSNAYACSGDGSVIVGEGSTENGSEAFIWDRRSGMRTVREALLAAYGPGGVGDLLQWRLEAATAISTDGTIIAGYGQNPGRQREAWLARIPTVCYANCDGSTTPPVLNVNDFICFQSKLVAGDTYANCDDSSTPPILNVNDFICFQSKFVAGCQ